MVQHICTASLPNLRPITTSVETRDQWMILDTQPVSTNMTGQKTQPCEDVSPIQNGDFLLALLIFWVVNLIINLNFLKFQLCLTGNSWKKWQVSEIELMRPFLGLSHQVCWLNHLKCGDLYFTAFLYTNEITSEPSCCIFLGSCNFNSRNSLIMPNPNLEYYKWKQITTLGSETIFCKKLPKKTEKPKTHVPSSSQFLSWSIVIIIWSQCEVEHLPTLQNPPHLIPGNVAATHRPDRLRMATIRAEQALAMDARSIHSWALTCWRHRYIEICWCHLSHLLRYGLFKGGRCLAACITQVLHVSSIACQATPAGATS